MSDAAASVASRIVLGAGDEHILDSISGHLPEALGPITTVASNPAP